MDSFKKASSSVERSEQNMIEFSAPEYLRNVIRIVTETGLRIYKELTPMKKDQLDLDNRTVWIPDSKTPNGVAEVPLTEIAADAFRQQPAISGPGPYLSQATRSQMSTRNRSRQSGVSRCGEQVFRSEEHTSSPRRTPHGSVPATLRTSGSGSCSDGAMRRYSRSTRR